MPNQNPEERISSLKSSLSKTVNYLLNLARQSPAKTATYMGVIALVSVAVTNKINKIRQEASENVETVTQTEEPETGTDPTETVTQTDSPECQVYRNYPSYSYGGGSYDGSGYSYSGGGYSTYHVSTPGCYVRPSHGYSPYDLYNQEYQMKRCLRNIQQELNAKEKRRLVSEGTPAENINCATGNLPTRDIWFVDAYPRYDNCRIRGHIDWAYPSVWRRTLGNLNYAQKQAKLNQCQQTLRMARSGHYKPPEDPLAFSMRQCVEQTEQVLHDRHTQELIAEGARPTSVYCPRLYTYSASSMTRTAAFSAPLPVKGACYVEEENKPKKSYKYLVHYRFLFSNEKKQSRLEKCENQLATLNPLMGRMQKCTQILKPLKEKKFREELIAQGVKPADIVCHREWGFWNSAKVECYDVYDPPCRFTPGCGSVLSTSQQQAVSEPQEPSGWTEDAMLSESQKQEVVDECETELASLQGEDELQEQMAKCLVDYAEILNRKTKADLHEGGTDNSDIICRSDIPTQSKKIWLVNYEQFKDYSKCALTTDNEPPYPYGNEPLPDDAQKQALLEECQAKLAEAEESLGDLDDIDRLAESMQECKQAIRVMKNAQHRAELIAQGSNPSDIVCHGYPSAEDEPLWYVDTWSDCYDQMTSERTPLPYDYGDYNENRELTDDQKRDFLNKCDYTLADLRREERDSSIATGRR